MYAFSDRKRRLRSIQNARQIEASESEYQHREFKSLAEQRHAGDGLQRPLRFPFQPRRMPSVRQS
jgi:hypothetical protein